MSLHCLFKSREKENFLYHKVPGLSNRSDLEVEQGGEGEEGRVEPVKLRSRVLA